MCLSYITKSKQLWYSPSDMQIKINSGVFSERMQIFYNFANKVYEKYAKYLHNNSLLDMEDVLEKAWDMINSKDNLKIKRKDYFWNKREIYISDIKYIMVDEYQDCNRLFFRIIKGLLNYNSNISLIAVWDDRQLINTFAWSDIQYFRDFNSPKKFWNSEANILTLRETFRCPSRICQIANEFYNEEGGSYSNISKYEVKWFYLEKGQYCYIEANTSNKENYEKDSKFFPIIKEYQKDKFWNYLRDMNWDKILLKDNNNNTIFIIDRKSYNMKYARYLKHLYEICIENFNLKKIFILYRTKNIFWYTSTIVKNHLFKLLQERYKLEYPNKKSNEINEIIENKIHFETLHSSKWREANLVIIIEICTSKFPLLHPDNELNSVFGNTIKDVLEEEKRLFYVWLTRTKDRLYYISEEETSKDYEDFLIKSWNI